MNVVKRIGNVATDAGDRPKEKVSISKAKAYEK